MDGVTGLLVRVSSDGQQVGQTTTNSLLQVTTSPLSDGVHVLTGTALGILGNVLPSTSAQLSLTIDTVLPQVSITTTLESEPLTSATRLSGTVDGTGTAIASLSYRFDNKSEILVPVSTNGTFDADLDFTGLEDGAHTLTVTTVDVAGNVATTNFNVQINLGENETAPVDLGSAYKFIGTTTPGDLKAREIDKYTFKVRGSELLSTATDKVLIGVTVRSASDSTLEPALPSIEGLTPLVTQSDTKSAFALFAIEREGQNLISVSGANNSTAGAYSLELSVGGDVNADGLVNNADTELLTNALGSTGTDAAYSPNLDLNRDRLINADDVELLNRNFGFIANLPPVFTPGDILTHQDLEATISLGDLVKDPDNDTVSYRASNPVNGTVQLSPDGLSAVFQPADGFAGTASFDLEFEDGGGTFFPATVEVNVSDAQLLRLSRLETGRFFN